MRDSLRRSPGYGEGTAQERGAEGRGGAFLAKGAMCVKTEMRACFMFLEE